MSHLLAALAFATIVATAAACGSPGSQRSEFVFTPVPYTVEPGHGPTPYLVSSDDSTGLRYLADQVVVQVRREHVDRFTRWANDRSFAVTVSIDDLGTCAFDRSQCPNEAPNGISVLVVQVPAGAAPEAVRFIADQEDVILAELNHVGRAD